MEKLLKKKLFIALIYFGCAFLMELLSFLVMGMGVFPVYWTINIAYMLVVSLLIAIIPNTVVSIVIGSVFLFFQMVISFVNEALKTMSGIVFGLNMLNLTKEVGGVFNSKFVNWFFLAGLLILFGGALAGMILCHKKIEVPKNYKLRNALCLLLVSVFTIGSGATLFSQIAFLSFNEARAEDGTVNYNDDHYLYKTQFISAKALQRFGYFGFYSTQISNFFEVFIDGFDTTMDEKTLTKLDEYFAEGQMSYDVYGENIYTGALRGKNLVVIVIESGEWYTINEEYTPTLYALTSNGLKFDKYYTRDKTNHSEAMSILGSYPGSSSGVNVSELGGHKMSFTLPNILSELKYTANYFHANEKSFYDRDLTHGGGGYYGYDNAMFLEDMRSLDGVNGKGELIKENFYDFDKDYKVMRDYFGEYTTVEKGDESFYTLHMTLSSHGHYDDLVEYGDYPFSDFTDTRYYEKGMTQEELLKKQKSLKKEFSKDCIVKNFEKYYEIIDGYPETPISADKGVKKNADFATLSAKEQEEVYLRYKRFQAGMMDLDEGLNTLISELNEAGELDDTAFFLYADHSSYYSELNYYLKGVHNGDSWNTDVYNIPCAIWYGGSMDCKVTPSAEFYDGYKKIDFVASADLQSPLKTGSVDKFACSFDIIPTLLHLMGVNHNLNMYHGVSMLTENAQTVFVSLESGIFNDNYYYDGITLSKRLSDGSWEQYDYEKTLEEDGGFSPEIEAFLDDSLTYYKRQNAFNDIYKYDYYAYRSVNKTYKVNGKEFSLLKIGE